MNEMQLWLKSEKPEEWQNFTDTMTRHGFVMDNFKSFEAYLVSADLQMKSPHNAREEKRNNLYALEHSSRQVVGNYLFSYWRYLTHWAGPYSSYEVDYLHRIILILKVKL